MKPTVRRLQQEYSGKIEFKSLDIDNPANDSAKKQYNFRGQPQFVFVNSDGKVVVSRNGTQTYDSLKKDLEALLKT
jgi:thioredoxin-like negative regulator of GroEL